VLQNKTVVYAILLRATADSRLTIAADPIVHTSVPGFEQMDREGIVTQQMRRDPLGHPASTLCAVARALDGFLDHGHVGPARKEPVRRTLEAPPVAEDRKEPRGQHHVPIVRTLAMRDAQDHAPTVDGGHGEPDGFGDAQAGRIAGGEQRAVLGQADAVGLPSLIEEG
jgi:hypothetical protein